MAPYARFSTRLLELEPANGRRTTHGFGLATYLITVTTWLTTRSVAPRANALGVLIFPVSDLNLNLVTHFNHHLRQVLGLKVALSLCLLQGELTYHSVASIFRPPRNLKHRLRLLIDINIDP